MFTAHPKGSGDPGDARVAGEAPVSETEGSRVPGAFIKAAGEQNRGQGGRGPALRQGTHADSGLRPRNCGPQSSLPGQGTSGGGCRCPRSAQGRCRAHARPLRHHHFPPRPARPLTATCSPSGPAAPRGLRFPPPVMLPPAASHPPLAAASERAHCACAVKRRAPGRPRPPPRAPGR